MNIISDRWKRATAHYNDGPWGKSRGGAGGSGGGSGGSGGGGDGPRNPWNLPPGGKGPRKPQGPAALDQIVEQFKQRSGGGNGSGNGGGGGGRSPFGDANQGRLIRNVFLGVIALWLIFTCFHRIGPQEQGVIIRLGKYAGTLSPGIGLTLPSPIDSVTKVEVQAIETVDIPTGTGENLILSGDQNIIDLAYSIRWDIKDPQNFLFQLAEPRETIREVAESAMREVVGSVSLNDAMGPSRSLIEQRVAIRSAQCENF